MRKLMRSNWLLFFIFLGVSLRLLNAQQTQRVYLSGKGCDDKVEWDFFCTQGQNSGHWDKIGVPSNWELEGFGSYNYGHDTNKQDEVGLYRTHFNVAESWKNKAIQLVFEGSMTDTEVKVNGHQAGAIHQGSFYCFKRDISKFVHYGKENLLEVKVSKMSSNSTVNSAERVCDFWVFGGIFRPVYLEVSPKIHISSTVFDAQCDGRLKADIYINKPIKDASVSLEIRDQANQLVGTCESPMSNEHQSMIEVEGRLANIKPWSTEYPHLYQAKVLLKQHGKVLHRLTQKIGFRTIEVRPQDGIYLNSKKIRIKGVDRHCAWPEGGRTTSKAISLRDAQLIKDMNINAVRMSHYPPDKHFLDACDSLGLMVLDELTAWSTPPYDTKVGTILVNEMLRFDVNHPCIIMWDNGNEGGFNYAFDPMFPAYDLQKREVLHPWGWSARKSINTVHYVSYNEGLKTMFSARDLFMPTECLHGLYDGGLGAGLDDYWTLMNRLPNAAGIFLWVFADEGVVRTDKNDSIDTAGNFGADGIVGPHREKEGSYFTIKNIWSPIQLNPFYITPAWNQVCEVENRYTFTNLNTCHLTYELLQVKDLNTPLSVVAKGSQVFPDIPPNAAQPMFLDLPEIWKKADILKLDIYDYKGHKLTTWTYDIQQPEAVAKQVLPLQEQALKGRLEGDCMVWKNDRLRIKVSTVDGLLKEVTVEGKKVPLSKGPLLINPEKTGAKPEVIIGSDQETLTVRYLDQKKLLFSFTWSMNQAGVLTLDYSYNCSGEMAMEGITFNYPEKKVRGCKLLARGPYRVYKNRL
ncbi:MAG: glycoside hydrolase family 2, partial [Massilibacteroides sp.]|nr:glycoside hydrolase family 2 [Massilibacteroides sp.]